MSRPNPHWRPDDATVAYANVTALMHRLELPDYPALHRWSVEDRAGFWSAVIDELGIVFERPPETTVSGLHNPETVRWLPGARMNIAESCFAHPGNTPAIITRIDGAVHTISREDLHRRVMQVVDGYRTAGFEPGHRIAIAMPMTVEAVVAYLGIVWAGGTVVSIADSFAAEEIETRLRITGTTTVITQDRIVRGGKELPMYEKVIEAGAGHAIVVDTGGAIPLRRGDVAWGSFLGAGGTFAPVAGDPETVTNILFSSGTTGDPKAIPWTHLTPIKSAMDGRYHHDIHAGDVVAWPTNLGWMMGPWLTYSSLINGAAMALYDDVPTSVGFVRFVADAGVTMLGTVPSLVAAWRAGDALDGVDWSSVRVLSSTGEASNAGDTAWLMDAAGGVPMIDYCGGTELGGGYIASTVVQPSVPAMFSTPTLGMDLVLMDEGELATSGEVFLVPPSIGMSQRLLNRDHHEAYYASTPTWKGTRLRRHGDHLEDVGDGYHQAHGRTDDTMNLGGIKVSSAEIERVVQRVDGVAEVAAIAVEPDGGGPSRLVLVVVAVDGVQLDPDGLRSAMQHEIRTHLNPLFKIHEVEIRTSLPRTASAKVMRRTLRGEYLG